MPCPIATAPTTPRTATTVPGWQHCGRAFPPGRPCSTLAAATASRSPGIWPRRVTRSRGRYQPGADPTRPAAGPGRDLPARRHHQAHPAGSGVRRRGVPVCPYSPAPGRATAAAEPHRRLATTRGLAAGDHRPPGLDRRRGRLARWHRAHVVEPRRRSDLSGVAGGGRPAGHRPGLRPRRRRRSHPVLGPPASTCQPANAVS
jgi:hypothetical protein